MFNITYYSHKDKKFITRRGKTDEKTREGISKKNNEKYFVYFDLDKMGYRTATKEWTIKQVA